MTNDQMNSLVESSAESLEQLRVLTQQDIASSKTLIGMGLKAGDTFDPSTNQINRVNSKDPQGRLLTIEDISNSRTLQDIGAEVGDVFADGQVYKQDGTIDGVLREFEYGFNKNGNVFTNLGDYLEAKFPLGRLVFGGDSLVSIERMPEEIQQLDVDQRLEYIKEQRMKELDEEFGANFNAGGSAAETLGGVGKAILDPINLLFAGRTVAGASGSGATIGALDSVLQQTVDGQEIDYGKVALQSGLTGVLAGGITKGIKVLQERPAAMTKRQRVFQESVDMKLAGGMKQFDALDKTAKEFGMSQGEVAKMVSVTGNKVSLGASGLGREAELDFDTRMVYDSVASSAESNAFKDAVLSINNRLDAIHPELGGAMKKHEAGLHVDTQARLTEVDGFASAVSKLPKSELEELSRRMFNQDFKGAESMLKRLAPDAIEEFPRMQRQLKRNAADLKAAGYEQLKLIKNYAPRVIKDREGLLDALGNKGRNQIEAMMKVKANQLNKPISELDEIETSDVLDKFFRGYRAKGTDGYTLASSKDRGLDIIPKNLMKYYHTIDEGLRLNQRAVANDVARRRFFGRDSKLAKDGTLDARNSVGSVAQRLYDRGEIDDAGLNYANKLISSRFVGGEATGNTLQKKIRELGFLGTITNPLSAITQFSDLAVSFYKNGLYNTMESFVRAVGNKSKVKQTEAGIDAGNKELQEIMEGNGAITTMLELGFRYSGFKAMDRIMKETTINAALNKTAKQARTSSGRNQLIKEYGPIFRGEMPEVIKDLQDGNITTSVKELLFSKLAEVQPISRAEMPSTYNANPNYRWMYMLKSFMLKQMDLAKRDIIDNIRSGNAKRIGEGIKNGVVLGSFYSLLGGSIVGFKDWLRGKEVFPDGFANEAVWSLGGVYSVNEYLVKDIKQGNFGEAAAQYIVPPFALFESAYKVVDGAITEDEDKLLKGVYRMPVLGPFVQFFMDNEMFGDY